MRRGTISLLGGNKPESKTQSISKTAAIKKPIMPTGRGTISLAKTQPKPAANKFGGAAKKAAAKKDNIPVLSNWKQEADGSITGKVSNTKVFRVGQTITTSPVRRGAKAGTVVTTSSGSKYRLN